MPYNTSDRVLESFTTTGTGAITTAGAVPGYRRFNAAENIAVGTLFCCFVEAVDANGMATGDWQTGVYQYTAANELTLYSFDASSSGSVISWAAGTKYIGVGPNGDFEFEQGRAAALVMGFAMP